MQMTDKKERQLKRSRRLRSVWNFVYSIMFRSRSARIGSIIVLGFIFLALLGPLVYPHSPTAVSRFHNQAPSSSFPLGTDNLGHDVLSQTIYGARSSIFVGVGAAAGAALLGLLVGVIAGYYDRLEAIFTGAADIIMTR